MSAAFLNGGQSLSAPFSPWCDSACVVLYSWVSIKGLVYVWFPCSVILLCGKNVQVEYKLCGIIVMYKEFLCNGTYKWEHIILFLVCSSSCHGTYVEKPVLSMGANMLTPPSGCGAFTPKRFLVRDGTIYVRMNYYTYTQNTLPITT